MNQNLNTKPKTVKLLEENKGESLVSWGKAKISLIRHQKGTSLRILGLGPLDLPPNAQDV